VGVPVEGGLVVGGGHEVFKKANENEFRARGCQDRDEDQQRR
jgi:hypothetical protein